MTTENLKTLVFRALDAAVENGYEKFVTEERPEEVAADMIYCDADVEQAGRPLAEVTALVVEWRAEQERKKVSRVPLYSSSEGR
jgi:hypothetical protein